MTDSHISAAHGKRCFVTIGATAPFNSLVKIVLEPPFLQALHDAKYKHLRVQYGDEGQQIFDQKIGNRRVSIEQKLGISVSGFSFNKVGLHDELRAVKGTSQAEEGIVISHAGSGSILDAMRLGIPLIVVPNSDLLHNHQVELAEVLAEQQYVVHGKISNLAASIAEVEQLRKRRKQWPPVNSGEEKYRNGLKGVMDEEMGWEG